VVKVKKSNYLIWVFWLLRDKEGKNKELDDEIIDDKH